MKLYYRFRRQDFSDQRLFSMKTFSISRNVHRWLHCAPWQFIQGQNNSEGTAAVARCTGSGRFNTSLWIRSAVRGFFFPSFPLTTINQLLLPPPCDWLMLHLFFSMQLPKCAPPLLQTHACGATELSLSQKQWFYYFLSFAQCLYNCASPESLSHSQIYLVHHQQQQQQQHGKQIPNVSRRRWCRNISTAITKAARSVTQRTKATGGAKL